MFLKYFLVNLSKLHGSGEYFLKITVYYMNNLLPSIFSMLMLTSILIHSHSHPEGQVIDFPFQTLDIEGKILIYYSFALVCYIDMQEHTARP